MIDRNPSAWLFTDGRWLHRPWWKVAINTMLRSFQPWPRKLVIFTRCEPTEGGDALERRPRALGFGIGRVLHESGPA